MSKALIRLEDISPAGWYETEEQQAKLLVIANELHTQSIPFHLAVIPRYIDPARGIDRSLTDPDDPVSVRFLRLLHKLVHFGASFGVHGYTHQYANATTGDGFEFAYDGCLHDCPPDDAPLAASSRRELTRSYAYRRLKLARSLMEQAGLTAVWFETPHYTASPVQRRILESCCGLMYETPPHAPNLNDAALFSPSGHSLSNGTYYVPTPLYYVAGDNIEGDVRRIQQAVQELPLTELASFFYHPYLEFPYIELQADGTAQYDPSSPLKRIISALKSTGRTFVPLTSLMPFIPDFRETGLPWTSDDRIHAIASLPGSQGTCQTATLLIRKHGADTWYRASLTANSLIKIDNGLCSMRLILAGWPDRAGGKEMVGDFNGDGIDDIAVWYSQLGQCHIALGTAKGGMHPSGVWLHTPDYADWDAYTGDFNGDGRDDLLFWNPAAGQVALALADLHGFRQPLLLTERIVYDPEPRLVLGIGDVNGDGQDDLVLWNPSQEIFEVWVSQGGHFYYEGVWFRTDASQLGSITSFRVTDVDGDGCDDLLLMDRVQGYWYIIYSSGKTFGPEAGRFGPWIPGKEITPLALDLAGSGRASLLAWSPDPRGGILDAAINTLDRTRNEGHGILHLPK
ncbi:DUF2334 domain-containing protein [Paenibacillus lactis]|uniref:DUF2334 domain-containing protein n=1 Tax=Paenibacillus lactis TaxID=228574 RepID=UPI00119E76BE